MVWIPGVKVLARAEVDWGPAYDDGHCDRQPHVREVWGDRETGVVAVFIDHQPGAGLYYPPTLVRSLRGRHWSAEVFDRRARARAGAAGRRRDETEQA